MNNYHTRTFVPKNAGEFTNLYVASEYYSLAELISGKNIKGIMSRLVAVSFCSAIVFIRKLSRRYHDF